MAMKVTDLMVGDWVNVTTTNQPRKIAGTNDMLFHDEYDPIPLTEEILVKNTVKVNGFTGTLYWFNVDICCIKPFGDNFLFSFQYGVNSVTLEIKYVYQLQHLLRLCGIEKEITLTD